MLVGGRRRQLRHSAADGELLQGFAQVLFASEHAGNAVDRVSDANLLIGGRGFDIIFHAYLSSIVKPLICGHFLLGAAQPRRERLCPHT